MTIEPVLLYSALALFAVRGACEYLVSADLFGGWWLPSWYSKARGTGAGWWPFRDDWHTAQFIRNRAHTLAALFVGWSAGQLWNSWASVAIAFVVAEIMFDVGHGATFSTIHRLKKAGL